MKLSLKIVKNAMPEEWEDNAPEPLRCLAKLAWTGAIMSDGVKCTDEMLNALLDNVKIENYAPPLILSHDWDVKNVVGKMVDIRRVGDTLLAEFDVTDREAQRKIQDGTWDSISLTYEQPEYKILECSLVAVPALLGAKIEPKDSAAEPEAEEKPAEEPVAEVSVDETVKVTEENACERREDEPERMEAEREEEADPEDMPEDKEKPEDVDEDEPEKRNSAIVDNAADRQAVSNYRKLKAEVDKLRKHNKELQSVIKNNARKARCERFINSWVQNGKTLPANAAEELELLQTMTEAQIAMYASLKAKTVTNCHAGKRYSKPAAPEQTRQQQFVAGYKSFLEGLKK